MKAQQRTFYITTLGCPKNVADSKNISRSLIEEGLTPINNPKKSDFHIINTCTFIKSATEETIETILDATGIKRESNQKLVVVGCFAERYSEAILEDIPEVDFVFGTGKYAQAGKLLKEKFPEDFQLEVNSSLIERDNLIKSYEKKIHKPYSYIKISDGCNRGCHFCIIPKLRGEYRDSSEDSILQDVKMAVASGSKEICLVSQDTVFYSKDVEKLESLIQKITEVKGVELLRLLYLYPDKKTYKLLDMFSKNPKIAPYLECPIQHTSDKILKLMNRSGSTSFYKDLFSKAREVKGLEIRTSIILGYPNEEQEDVDSVLKFIEEVRPEKLALFAFSPQEGTEAEKLKQTVTKKEAAKRVNLVREKHLEILNEIHLSRVGKLYPAIIDEVHKEHSIARRFQDAPEMDEIVYIPNTNLKPGDIGKVRVLSFSEYDMEGEWISE